MATAIIMMMIIHSPFLTIIVTSIITIVDSKLDRLDAVVRLIPVIFLILTHFHFHFHSIVIVHLSHSLISHHARLHSYSLSYYLYIPAYPHLHPASIDVDVDFAALCSVMAVFLSRLNSIRLLLWLLLYFSIEYSDVDVCVWWLYNYFHFFLASTPPSTTTCRLILTSLVLAPSYSKSHHSWSLEPDRVWEQR